MPPTNNKCRFCDKSYESYGQLRDHIKSRHGDRFLAVKRWLEADRFHLEVLEADTIHEHR